MNSLFQVVLDRELGNGPDGRPRRLHPETQVIAAVNVGSDYTVNEMDPALLSRFAVYDFKPTVHDWLEWAQGRVDQLIIDFIRNHPEHLRPTKQVEPGRIAPNQRSWVRLNDALVHAGIKLSENGGNCPAILYPLASGFIGVEAAASLKSFVDNYESVIHATDILDGWNKGLSDRIQASNAEARLALIEKIKVHCAENIWTTSQINNLVKFFKLLTGEQKFALHTAIMSTSVVKNVAPYHSLVQSEIMPIIDAAVKMSKK
jgi:MoxR-like ATPase